MATNSAFVVILCVVVFAVDPLCACVRIARFVRVRAYAFASGRIMFNAPDLFGALKPSG